MAKKSNRRTALGVGVALGSLAMAAHPAHAQAAAQTPQTPVAQPTEQTGLADIIVTATKRSENVQRVPIAVTVVSSEMIKAQNLVQTSDLARVAPTVTFTAGALSIANIFSIRGIGTFATNSGLEPSVGVVLDGVPLVRVVGSLGDLTDLDHVEVLNGPQGTLFGKNASAGVISLTTKAPKMGVTELDARASYASFNNIQISGTANVPLTANITARVTVFHNEHSGLTHDIVTGKDYDDLNTTGVHAKIRFEPTSNFDFTLSGEANRNRENGLATTIVALNTSIPGYAETVAPYIGAYDASHGINDNHENNQTTTTRPDLQSSGNTRAVGGQFNYKLGTHTITGLLSWRQVKNYDAFFDGGGGPQYFPDNFSNDGNNIRQTTAELRVASPTGKRLRYVAGVFFQHMNLDELFRLDTQLSVSGPQDLNADTYFSIASNLKETTNNYAGFGEATYDLTDRLRLTAGGRVAHDDVSGSLNRSVLRGPSGALPPPLTGPGGPFGPVLLSASTKYTNLSGRGSVQYDIVPGSMLYFTASRGYKGPGVSYGYTSTAAVGGTVRPEIATSFEAGLKSTLFDHRLRVNISAFDTAIKDFQVSVPSLAEGPGAFTIRNAKQLKSTGGQIDLDAKITQAWTISGSAAYTHARFTNFSNAGCFPGQTVAQGCVDSFQTVNGAALPNAPKWVLNASTRYDTPLSATLTGFAQLSGTWQSKVVFTTDRDPYTVQKGYAIANILVGIKTPDEKYSLSVFANNLFNQHYLAGIHSDGNGSFYTSNQVIGAYRSVGVALDTHF